MPSFFITCYIFASLERLAVRLVSWPRQEIQEQRLAVARAVDTDHDMAVRAPRL